MEAVLPAVSLNLARRNTTESPLLTHSGHPQWSQQRYRLPASSENMLLHVFAKKKKIPLATMCLNHSSSRIEIHTGGRTLRGNSAAVVGKSRSQKQRGAFPVAAKCICAATEPRSRERCPAWGENETPGARAQGMWGLVCFHGYLPLFCLWNMTAMPPGGLGALSAHPDKQRGPVSLCPQPCARGQPTRGRGFARPLLCTVHPSAPGPERGADTAPFPEFPGLDS